MPNKKLDDRIKKNLLDLEFNKYLQYYNTSIIILFTYFIGVIIAFLTKQIDYKSVWQMVFMSFVSALIILIILVDIFNFKWHLKSIPQEIRKLSL